MAAKLKAAPRAVAHVAVAAPFNIPKNVKEIHSAPRCTRAKSSLILIREVCSDVFKDRGREKRRKGLNGSTYLGTESRLFFFLSLMLSLYVRLLFFSTKHWWVVNCDNFPFLRW